MKNQNQNQGTQSNGQIFKKLSGSLSPNTIFNFEDGKLDLSKVKTQTQNLEMSNSVEDFRTQLANSYFKTQDPEVRKTIMSLDGEVTLLKEFAGRDQMGHEQQGTFSIMEGI